MIDPKETQRLNEIIIQNSANAEEYRVAREKAAHAKYKLDVLAGAKYLSDKLNVKAAYEKALILIASENDDNKQLYQDLLKYKAIYKGLEKVIEANAGQIMWAQSKMRFIRDYT